jgi:hypothetical protein
MYFSATIAIANVGAAAMTDTISIHINQSLYELARQDAARDQRTVSEQIEFWACLGRAALDNPDLPAEFIAETLAALAERRSHANAFVPRSGLNYERLLERIEDLEDALLAKERANGPFVEVNLDDL